MSTEVAAKVMLIVTPTPTNAVTKGIMAPVMLPKNRRRTIKVMPTPTASVG